MNSENQNAAVGFPPGTKIGKYEIVERLGIGGQAIVYRAHDAMLDRYVAIKQISSHLAEKPEFLERFRKEAQILAKLASSEPALVTIHELIQEERGLFIVMEYVPGHTLETMLNDGSGPAEPKAVLQILWRLAAGLHAVHSAGIIHRDIKPGNIIIGEGLKVKIADFGVAAVSGGQTSMVLGTTKYMAPELYGGKTVDARADMYSLGFIAYEMLLGRAKFNELFADVVRDKHSEALRWMKWHGNEQVTAPPLNELNDAIPKPLADIVAMMMIKNVELRFGTMEQLGRAIKASFSPRASAGRSARHAHVPAPGTPPPVLNGQLPALENEDELEIPSDSPSPDTAPLPPRKMPLKTKLILAGAGVLVLVLALVGWQIVKGIQSGNVQKALQTALDDAQRAINNGRPEEAQKPLSDIVRTYAGDQAAKGVLDEAMKAYQEKQYAQALAAFKSVVRLRRVAVEAPAAMADADKVYADATAKDVQGLFDEAAAAYKTASILYGTIVRLCPTGDPGARSGVREHLSLARQAMADAAAAKNDKDRQPFWSAASSEGEAAKKDLDDAQRRQNNLGPWVNQLQKEIDEFGVSRTSCRLFWAAIDKARALLDAGNFNDARTNLNKDLINSAIHLTSAQSAVVSQLRQKMDATDFESQFAAVMASAKDAVKQGNFPIAMEQLRQAAKLLKDPLGKSISVDAYKKHEDEVRARWRECASGGDYNKELEQAKEAKDNNEKATELEHVLKANGIRPSKELEERAKTIQSEMALEEGKALAKDLKLSKAKEKFQESLNFKENQEAKDLLAKIDLTEKFQALLKDAQAAFNRQDYRKAAESYQKAQDIDPSDDEVKTKLHLCLYQVRFAEAQALLKEKKTDEAAKKFQECRDLMPEKGPEIDAILEDIRVTGDYDKVIEEGNAFLGNKQYSKARERYAEAQKIKDTPQAKDLIIDTHYLENLGRGKQEMAEGRFKSAAAMFKIAQSKRDTPEIRKLIEEAHAKVKEEEK